MDTSGQLEKSMKAARLSLTVPRKVVFKALQNHDPQAMSELVAHCPGVDRASVYRTVALFEQLGVVQRIQVGWKYKLELSDTFQAHHHHLHCTGCGKLAALPEDRELEEYLRSTAWTHGFSLQTHQVELRGLCKACQGHKTNKKTVV